MLVFTHTDLVDTSKYEEHLRYRGYIYIDLELMKDKLKDYKERQDTYRILALNAMNISVPFNKRYAELSKTTILNYLIEDCYLDENNFRKKGTNGLSLDAKKVIAPLLSRLTGYPKEMLQYYTEFNSLKSKNSRITNVVSGKELEEGLLTRDGSRIAKLNFSVSVQENLRYNYKDEDIISLSKDYKSCTVVPEGYFLAWGDYAQSDWRIAYNLLVRDERNSSIMDACNDKYEGLARVLAEFYDETFDLDEFKANRDLYKVYVLQTIYGQRNGLDEKSDQFIHRFTKYLETCPRYMKYYNDLQKRCKFGTSVEVVSYFGFSQLLSSGLKPKDAINKALNTPNQTGTSEIVILSVNAIMYKFANLGYSEEDVAVYFVRHDEPIFILKENVVKDLWVFADCKDIYVDDWTPLSLTFKFGYRYGEEDSDLYARYELSTAANISRINTEVVVGEHYDYSPMPKILFMSVCAMSTVGGEILITYYAYEDNLASFELLNGNEYDNSSLQKHITDKMKVFTITARQKGYNSIECNANFFKVDFSGVLRVFYTNEHLDLYNKAILLSEAYLLDRMGKRHETLDDEHAPYFVVLDECGDLFES